MAALLTSPTLQADSFFDMFIDPEDGYLDGSDFLLEHDGILPVPIFITEPAVGNGLGLAGVYFHDPDPAWEGKLRDVNGRQRPSSISAGAVGATSNDSKFVGGLISATTRKILSATRALSASRTLISISTAQAKMAGAMTPTSSSTPRPCSSVSVSLFDSGKATGLPVVSSITPT